ncbi:hypothetical protein SLE2022_188870 [Rubroshorea leprosula]
MHPLHLPWSFFLFIIITFVLIHAPKFASSMDERYLNCKERSPVETLRILAILSGVQTGRTTVASPGSS